MDFVASSFTGGEAWWVDKTLIFFPSAPGYRVPSVFWLNSSFSDFFHVNYNRGFWKLSGFMYRFCIDFGFLLR